MAGSARSSLFAGKLGRDTLWAAASKLIATASFFGVNIFLARHLGVAAYGAWSYFFSILMIATVLSYAGVNASSRIFAARYAGSDREGAVCRHALIVRTGVSALAATAIAVGRHALAGMLGEPGFAPLFLAGAPLLATLTVTDFFRNMFTGMRRIGALFILNAVEYGARLALVIGFVAYSQHMVSVIAAFTAAGLLAIIVCAPLLWKQISARGGGDSHILSILRYSLPMWIIGMGFLIMTELDTAMLGFFSTEREVGVYAAAKQIINKLPQIALIMSMSLMPMFARVEAHRADALKTAFKRLVRQNIAIFSIITVAILLLAPALVAVFFGSAYAPSATPLRILSLWLPAASTNVLLNGFMDYRTMAGRRALHFALGLGLNVGLNMLLIPRFGATGAAWATLLASIPYYALNAFAVFQQFRLLSGSSPRQQMV
jgi:O-antigen/teichoic acid export membrane protein